MKTLVRALAILCITTLGVAAQQHQHTDPDLSWVEKEPGNCCGPDDCRKIPRHHVVDDPRGGVWAKRWTDGEWSYWPADKVRMSPKPYFVQCIYNGGDRCIFILRTGV